jgi:hypothetical protein
MLNHQLVRLYRKHRRVGVESGVVNSILMLERRYSQVMEKLLV